MCPNCHKFLTKADKKDPRTHKLGCKHCGKWIWYVPNDDDNFQIYNKIMEKTKNELP